MEAERAALRSKVSRALALFESQHYEEAKNEFLTIYEIKQLHLLLFNIGSCYRKLGDFQKAIPYYETFIQRAPDSPLLAEAKAYLAQMQAKLEADRIASTLAENREAAERQLQIAEQRRLEAETIAKANYDLRRRAEAGLLPAGPERPIYRRPWFWVTIGGLSLVAIGTAVGIGVWQHMKNPPEPNSDLDPQTIRF